MVVLCQSGGVVDSDVDLVPGVSRPADSAGGGWGTGGAGGGGVSQHGVLGRAEGGGAGENRGPQGVAPGYRPAVAYKRKGQLLLYSVCIYCRVE